MARLSLRSQLLLAFTYVLVLAIVALLVPLVGSVRARVNAEVRTQALAQAEVVAATVPDTAGAGLSALAAAAGRTLRGRVLVVDPAGRIRADSASSATLGTSYASRPEIAAALSGRIVQSTRQSGTLRQAILATAVPVLSHGRPHGAVRITQSVAAVQRAVLTAGAGLVLVGGVVLALGLAAAAVVARGLAGPLHRLAAVTRRVAAGDLTVRAEEQGSAEQRQLAHAFNDMTDRLERMIRSQRQFVADASHQLRTPLTGVRLRLEEASAAAGDRPVQIHLDRAMTEVDRLSAIVAELLVLSHAADARPRREVVELASAARAAQERWAAAAAEHGAQLVLETSRGTGSVSCAGADVDRILDTLLENALAYGPDGQTIRLLVADRRVEVHDQGPGPAPGEEEAVFARFHRGAAARNGPAGTGLGLPIARELARRWGGDVALTATRDGGRAVVTF